MTKTFIERVLNNNYATLDIFDRHIQLTSDTNSDNAPDIIQTIDNYTLLIYYEFFAKKNGFYNNINWDIVITDTAQLSSIFTEVENYCNTNNI